MGCTVEVGEDGAHMQGELSGGSRLSGECRDYKTKPIRGFSQEVLGDD